MNNCKIYSLNCPYDNSIRYIGYTSLSIEYRMYEHLRHVDSKSPNSHKNKWLRSLFRNNKKPTIHLLYDNLTKEEAIKMEIKLIAELRSQGVKLTNNTDGGEGGTGYVFKKEVLDKLAKHRRGRKTKPASEERKRKVSEANKGKKRTNEFKEKMRNRFISIETRIRNSKASKGRKLSDSAKKKMSEARKLEWKTGKRKIGFHSLEARKKARESRTRRRIIKMGQLSLNLF